MTPAQIVADLRRSTKRARAAKPRPCPELTKAELAAKYDELLALVERAAGLANDLGRDLRGMHQIEVSNRAYGIRDVLRGGL